MKDPLLKALQDSIGEGKSKEEAIEDGKAMGRLLRSEDFKRYQNLLLENHVAIIRRLGLVGKDDLQMIQGAIVQSEATLKVPQKTYDKIKSFLEAEHAGRD